MDNRTISQIQTGASAETAASKRLKQAFAYMSGGLALTALVSWFTIYNQSLLSMAASQGFQILFFAIWIGFSFFMHKIIFKLSPAGALFTLIAFSAFTGFALAPAFFFYLKAAVLWPTFLGASVMFGAAAFIGYSVEKSFSANFTKVLSMLSIGLLIAIVANVFINSGMFSLIISMAVVPLVLVATVMEISQLKSVLNAEALTESEQTSIAIYAATSLYMSFVVLLMHLLNIVYNLTNNK